MQPSWIYSNLCYQANTHKDVKKRRKPFLGRYNFKEVATTSTYTNIIPQRIGDRKEKK